MKNKKAIIIIIICVTVLAILFAVFKIRSSYFFKEDGTLFDGHRDLIERLKSIEDKEERKTQVDFSVESNLITQKEANELY